MKLRWNWGTGIAAVYTAFALGTSGMVAFAMHERVDLVSDDYYEQAVGLDAHRLAESRAAALGDGFIFAPNADTAEVSFTWPNALPIESGSVTFYRPSDATKDRSVAIAPDANRHQIVSLAGLAPGRWLIQASWRSRGETYFAERDVIVRAAR